eukprot:1147424-Pelagomonas_calceolata.AAC.1
MSAACCVCHVPRYAIDNKEQKTEDDSKKVQSLYKQVPLVCMGDAHFSFLRCHSFVWKAQEYLAGTLMQLFFRAYSAINSKDHQEQAEPFLSSLVSSPL